MHHASCIAAGRRLRIGMLIGFINTRSTKVLWAMPLSEFLVWSSTWPFWFEPNVEKCWIFEPKWKCSESKASNCKGENVWYLQGQLVPWLSVFVVSDSYWLQYSTNIWIWTKTRKCWNVNRFKNEGFYFLLDISSNWLKELLLYWICLTVSLNILLVVLGSIVVVVSNIHNFFFQIFNILLYLQDNVTSPFEKCFQFNTWFTWFKPIWPWSSVTMKILSQVFQVGFWCCKRKQTNWISMKIS